MEKTNGDDIQSSSESCGNQKSHKHPAKCELKMDFLDLKVILLRYGRNPVKNPVIPIAYFKTARKMINPLYFICILLGFTIKLNHYTFDRKE